MRIVQFTDIHLSENNLEKLRNFYLQSLINDLDKFHKLQPIDIILITGDLVDRGGDSLGKQPYNIFQEEFINPILEKLNLKNDQILFLPGNHDVNVKEINYENENYLANNLTTDLANEIIKENKKGINESIKRLQAFKSFEKEFHKNTVNYEFSLMESSIIKRIGDNTVGFALINDSWRCSPTLTTEKHFIGINQLFSSIHFFSSNKTDINIVAFHHPIESFSPSENEEIDNVLKSQNFDIAFFGHNHGHKYESVISSNGSLLVINGRAGFNDSGEKEAKYQPGYNIVDINLNERSYKIYARKYVIKGHRFDRDVDSLPDGEISGYLSSPNPPYPLTNTSNVKDIDLPAGYSADVKKIVQLLIGKSLYPDQYVFVRELIQNSVDACNRVKDRYPERTIAIKVMINTVENYFEIIDQGDGMSKRVLKEHFAVIGKSISQEFIDSINETNLISQFGIGFMSTFIVAQKIYIQTKSEEDGLVNFEISNVFNGFKYTPSSDDEKDEIKQSGTSIKVYLKRNVNAGNILTIATGYCRHIENLSFYLNGHLQPLIDSWNIESEDFISEDKNSKYQYKLEISLNTKDFIASNSGFFLNTNSLQIIPYKFPFNIGGEVLFNPKAIDFDLSRTKIMETDKSREFKKEISIVLRDLFLKVIESNNSQMKALVLNYLYGYLTNYDSNQFLIQQSYSNFYSKKELIDLCTNLATFDFIGRINKLSDILNAYRFSGKSTVYYYNNIVKDEDNIVRTYLYWNGFLIIQNTNITIPFREGADQFQLASPLTIILQASGFQLVDIQSISAIEMGKMKINKQTLPEKINICVNKIELANNIKIEIASLGREFKPTLHFNNEYIINYTHQSFQDLLSKIETFDNKSLEIYFLGLIGLSLSCSSTFNP